MATITVRNLPARVVDSLKARAKLNGKSMEQQVREILEANAMDRQEIFRYIEKELWPKIENPPTKEEIDEWIDDTWKHRP